MKRALQALKRFFSNPTCVFCLGLAVVLTATTIETLRGRATNFYDYYYAVSDNQTDDRLMNLQNGTQVFVDSWNCNVEGQFYDGCSAVVYYIDYPSTDNVYRADIFGNMGLIIPDEDQGGWAGSHYYDNEWDYADEDQGGWAGSNYYDNESDYSDGVVYDPVGDEHNRVTCPLCGNHFSPGLDECPVCGWTP